MLSMYIGWIGVLVVGISTFLLLTLGPDIHSEIGEELGVGSKLALSLVLSFFSSTILLPLSGDQPVKKINRIVVFLAGVLLLLFLLSSAAYLFSKEGIDYYSIIVFQLIVLFWLILISYRLYSCR